MHLAAIHTTFQDRAAATSGRGKTPITYHATTWQLAFDDVCQTPGALELLNLCSFLALNTIPLDLIQGMGGEASELLQETAVLLPELLASPLKFNKAIAALRRFSLIERSDDLLTMHRMVQMVARDQMGNEEAWMWATAAIEIIISVLPDYRQLHTWKKGALILAQMTAIADKAANVAFSGERLAFLDNWIGYYVKFRGSYAAAQPYYQRALNIREKILGSDHPDTAQSLNNMGLLLQAMGYLATARPYFQRAIDITEKVFGFDHPDTAQSLNNMGTLLQAMGNLTAARPFYQQALAIFEKVLGPDHPHTKIVRNNLATLDKDLQA
ncbi:MAG: tetratricopeptide repeat protein [Chloroflexi bacterium]|nr:tetratricopeptide repeat protein [Chloroflexota bacterium]